MWLSLDEEAKSHPEQRFLGAPSGTLSRGDDANNGSLIVTDARAAGHVHTQSSAPTHADEFHKSEVCL